MTLEQVKLDLEACRQRAIKAQDTFDTEVALRHLFQQTAYEYALLLLAEHEASQSLTFAPQCVLAPTG